MNQVLAGTIALIIGLALWGLGKKPRYGLNSDAEQEFLGVQNELKLVLVESNKEPGNQQNQIKNTKIEIDWQPPNTTQKRIFLKKRLNQLISGGPRERLQAIILSDLWGHKNVLPILRRGLKDSDSDVVAAAAMALAKHKGFSYPLDQETETLRPPRNAALMR